MKRFLLILALFLLYHSANAQSAERIYYYYKGQKIYYPVSYNRLVAEMKPGYSFTVLQNRIANLLKIPKDSVEQTFVSNQLIVKRNANPLDGASLSALQILPGLLFIRPVFVTPSGNYNSYGKTFIVKLKSATRYTRVKKLMRDNGCVLVRQYPFQDDIFILAAGENAGYDGLAMANLFYETGLFDYAEPDKFVYHALHVVPNDPLYNLQWAHNNAGTAAQFNGTPGADMKIQQAWDISMGQSYIKIAVIDEGVDLTHPDLQANLLQGFNGATLTSNPGDGAPLGTANAHGTNCAGIIAAIANNNLGMAGVAPNCKIIPAVIFNAAGNYLGDAAVAASFDYVRLTGADVISNSWGGGSVSSTIDAAINRAVTLGRYGKGCMVLVSSGNDNASTVSYPANNSQVISVGGVSMCNQRKSPVSCDGENWWGANYGTGLDVVAPCVKIASTDIQGTGGYNTAAGVAGNYYNIFNGTSSACPNAAGVAALLYSVDSSLTLLQATQIFELSCDKLPAYTYAISSDPNQPNGTWNTQTGHGRVNALAALQLAQSGNYCVSQIQASGTTICSTPILLSIVNAVAGATYEWRRNGVVVGAGLTYSTAVAGNYDAVVTRGTCTAVSAVVILSKSVILSASASPDSVCAGGSSTLTANAVNSFSYCTPTYTNGTGAGDYISYVNIATTTLNNTTTGAASPYYTLFPQSGSTTASLAAAAGYTLSLRGGTYATCLIRGWIDYNQDGVFAATETIGISANVGSQALGTISFTVPAGAANGVTRLRLRSSDTNPGPGTGTACAATNSSWGETEDYVITIAGGVSPFTYSWAEVPVNGTLITNNMASVTASGISLQETYTVTVTSTLGCTNTFSQVVNVKALNSIVAATPAVSPLCGSATTTITANGVAGTNPVVTWFTAAGGTGTNLGTGINLSNAGAGTYYARVTGTCGAAAETVVTIAAITPTAISIDAAPATQTIMISAPAANLSVTANGNNLTYQWYSNSININSGGTDLGAANGAQTTSFSPLTNSAGILYYYCIVTGDCGSTSSGTAQVTVVTANTWKSGNPTNDWNTGNNWSLGVIPTGSSNALIPTGNTPYPALSLSSAVNNLIIQAGATVNLNGYLFTINGTLSGTGTLSGSPVSSLEINATNTLRFATGANSLRNFTVNSAAVSLANQLTIAAGLSAGNEGNLLVTGTGILNTGGNLTIESNQFGTASIAQGSASGNYINGDVTVERYIDGSPKRAWRMLAAPTYGQTIKQSWQENQSAGIDPGTGYGTIITSNSAGWLGSGFDYQTPGNSLLVYNPVTNAWETVANTALPVSTAGANKAYMIFIRGNRSATPFNGPYSTATVLRTKGPVFQGDQPPVSLPGAGKFSVIGNNYASAIDFTTITDPNIDPMFLVWDPKLAGSRGLGGYQTFAATNGWQPTPGGGSYPAAVPNTTIQSGQAFAVYTTPGNGNITLYESSKVTGSNMVFRPMTAIVSFRSNLYAVSDGTEELADGNTVVFNSDLSNEVDNRDAIKLENIGENLGVLRRGKLMAVEGRQPIGINDTIFFRMSKLRTQKYRLKFAAENFSSNVAVFLEDKFLQTSTPVDMQYDNSFDFNIAADTVSSAADRFRIVFKQVALLPVTFISLTAIRRAPIVNVGWKVGSENGIVAYEVQRSTDGTVFITAGNVVVAGSVTANEKLYNFTDMSFTAGTVFYRVKSIGINGETKYSDIVKLTEGKIKPGYTVSPNPVNRNVVNIIFENKCRGKYQLRLLAMDGKLLQSATTEHAGGSASQQLNLNAAVTRGNYLLEITAPGEIKTTERIFISDSK